MNVALCNLSRIANLFAQRYDTAASSQTKNVQDARGTNP
ncbi:hypothetical protein ARMA_1670 [Ardenticatena maritima]|uniref:Uncharacterized protein n=1 Tax=Ardenticatena maritima TaxID=872965 RepID=A0A0M9UCU6_9CHLR|nr:hypothetical protein ARMA_1670 [Ardenticatena maritima]